jgi:hypothetical protein
LLDAIAFLRGDAPRASPPTLPEESAALNDTPERRQVTVMFAELVGSTALSARMDPEDLREVITAYQKRVSETVTRLAGFVAKYMGDGVLIYFGYPRAHEDDAERAARAGLELIDGVASLKSSVTLQTRVGIATGLVVVGDLVGSSAAQEHGKLTRITSTSGMSADIKTRNHRRIWRNPKRGRLPTRLGPEARRRLPGARGDAVSPCWDRTTCGFRTLLRSGINVTGTGPRTLEPRIGCGG